MIDCIVREHPEVQGQLATGELVGRLGAPEKIASALVWLCSEAFSFVTGRPSRWTAAGSPSSRRRTE
jgi:NAD(P)-dependent dehydrogenase (short-subunit alcohol dehydrogenase family)